MNYRIASLLSSEAADTAATKTIDITVNKPISRITVQFKGTNNGSTPTAHPAKMISKIELVDGSNVLYSMSGIEAQAMNFFETGRMPLTIMEYRNDVMAIATFELNFGRWLWDELLAFDATKFSNPQLRITHDKALGGSTPDAGLLSVFAHAFDQKAVAPTGFLMTKEQYGYTLVASAKEHIDLATDLPYRALMIKSLTAGKQPWEQYNQIKLSENNDQVVIINDEKTSDLLKLLDGLNPIQESIIGLSETAGVTHYQTSSYNTGIVGVGLDAFNAAISIAQNSGGSFILKGDAGESCQVNAQGQNPHGCLLLPFGKQMDIADWYDVTKVGSLKLTITAGSGASGTAEIVSQQLKLYGK